MKLNGLNNVRVNKFQPAITLTSSVNARLNYVCYAMPMFVCWWNASAWWYCLRRRMKRIHVCVYIVMIRITHRPKTRKRCISFHWMLAYLGLYSYIFHGAPLFKLIPVNNIAKHIKIYTINTSIHSHTVSKVLMNEHFGWTFQILASGMLLWLIWLRKIACNEQNPRNNACIYRIG